MTAFVYDPRMVPFLWAGLRPVKPEHLTYDRTCLVVLPTGRVPLYPFHTEKATFLFPFSTSACQIKLDTREAVIGHVEAAFLVRTNKDTRKRLLALTDEEFFQTLKMTCALKKWRLQEDADAKTYKLFGDLMDNNIKALHTLFGLLRDKSMPEIWAAVLTFLSRAEHLEDQRGDTTPYYLTLLTRSNKLFVGWRPRAMALLGYRQVSDINLVAAAIGLRS